MIIFGVDSFSSSIVEQVGKCDVDGVAKNPSVIIYTLDDQGRQPREHQPQKLINIAPAAPWHETPHATSADTHCHHRIRARAVRATPQQSIGRSRELVDVGHFEDQPMWVSRDWREIVMLVKACGRVVERVNDDESAATCFGGLRGAGQRVHE